MAGEYMLAVMNADGTGLDSTFGTSGVVDTGLRWDAIDLFPPDAGPSLWFGTSRNALLVDSQGRLVVVGGTRYDDGKYFSRLTATRLLPDGTADDTFGIAEISTVPNPHLLGTIAARLDSADNLLLAGFSMDISSTLSFSDFVVRLRAEDGTPDPDFGLQGYWLSTYKTSAQHQYFPGSIMDLDVDDEDRVVLLLRNQSDGTSDDDHRFGMTRLTASGLPDDAFPAPTIGGPNVLPDAATETRGRVALGKGWDGWSMWLYGWVYARLRHARSDACLESSTRDSLLRVVYIDNGSGSDLPIPLGLHQRVRFWKTDGSYDFLRNTAVVIGLSGKTVPFEGLRRFRVPGDAGGDLGAADSGPSEAGMIKTAKSPVDESIATAGIGMVLDGANNVRAGTYVMRLTAENENDADFDPGIDSPLPLPTGAAPWAFFEDEVPHAIAYGPAGELCVLTTATVLDPPNSDPSDAFDPVFRVRCWKPDGSRDAQFGATGDGSSVITVPSLGAIHPLDIKVLDDGRIAILAIRPSEP